MACMTDNPDSDKLYGFDKWEVKSAVSTLKEAEEIKKKDPKFLEAVQKHADAEAMAAKEAATKLRSITKIQKKMDKVYGNPGTHKKGGY